MTLGQKIAILRNAMKIYQEQLAEKLNVTPQKISRWETENAYPDITAIPILANIFDVSIDEVVGNYANLFVLFGNLSRFYLGTWHKSYPNLSCVFLALHFAIEHFL